MDADTILSLAIAAITLLGLGALLVAWRAIAAADRARMAVRDDREMRRRITNQADTIRQLRGELEALSLVRRRPTPDATREMHIVRGEAT